MAADANSIPGAVNWEMAGNLQSSDLKKQACRACLQTRTMRRSCAVGLQCLTCSVRPMTRVRNQVCKVTALRRCPFFLVLAGRGAYGTVWKARDSKSNMDVAIKVIPLADTDAEELQSIQKEIQFLAGCNHPNIVKYLVRTLRTAQQAPTPRDCGVEQAPHRLLLITRAAHRAATVTGGSCGS